MNKPFVLFTGMDYYPYGGWDDYHSRHSSLEEAKKAVADLKLSDDLWTWYQIVDVEWGEEVLSGDFDEEEE